MCKVDMYVGDLVAVQGPPNSEHIGRIGRIVDERMESGVPYLFRVFLRGTGHTMIAPSNLRRIPASEETKTG